MSWPEYQKRLVDEQDRAVAAGRCVVLIRARVADVLAEFPLNSTKFTAAACEVALRAIYKISSVSAASDRAS